MSVTDTQIACPKCLKPVETVTRFEVELIVPSFHCPHRGCGAKGKLVWVRGGDAKLLKG